MSRPPSLNIGVLTGDPHKPRHRVCELRNRHPGARHAILIAAILSRSNRPHKSANRSDCHSARGRALLGWVGDRFRGCQMINRRRAVHLILAALPLAWPLRSSTALAEQAFARFIPFLIDLDGWQGKKAEGLSMEMPGNSMITATREYQRGASRLHAQIITGAAAQGALAATRTGMNIETSEGRMNSTTSMASPRAEPSTSRTSRAPSSWR